MEPNEADVLRMRRERDLYRKLTQLGDHVDVDPFLADALAAVVELSGAAHGLLEVYDDHDGPAERRWVANHGLLAPQVEAVRAAVSRGSIAQTLAAGTMIVTASALLDPRFFERASVRVGGIEAVMCAPVGESTRVGVLYLQGRVTAGPFTADDREVAEIFASHLGPIMQRLLARCRDRRSEDATREVRQRLACKPLVGRSAAIARMLEQLASVAPLDVTVLLMGASGTGKSLAARVIHDNSPRRTARFVEVNCAALPEALVESELWSVARSAFDGHATH